MQPSVKSGLGVSALPHRNTIMMGGVRLAEAQATTASFKICRPGIVVNVVLSWFVCTLHFLPFCILVLQLCNMHPKPNHQ